MWDRNYLKRIQTGEVHPSQDILKAQNKMVLLNSSLSVRKLDLFS